MNNVEFFNQNYDRWHKFGSRYGEKYAKYTYQDKEDLVQEGMLVIWRTILDREWRTPSFLQDRCNSGIFAAYKRGKSINNHYQNKNRRRHRFSTENIEDFKEGVLDKRASPAEMAIDSIMLETFCNRLSSKEQLFLKLKLDGYFLKEIKKIMGMGSNRLQLLVGNLKRIYAQVYEDGGNCVSET